MTTTYDWHTTYTNAVETFNGQTPGPQLEAELLETFKHSPQTVITAIDKAAAAYKAGKITSPWGIVRTELARIASQPHVQVADSSSREKAIARAEAWIHHTGLRLTETQVIDHLFAPQRLTADLTFLEQHEQDTRGNPGRPLYEGLLKAAIRRTRQHGPEPVPNTGGPLTEHDTPALRQRMIAVWAERQPVRETLEAEELERAEAWKRQQTLIAQARTQAVTEADHLPF